MVQLTKNWFAFSLIILLLLRSNATGQLPNQYNLNLYNGLPSNLVYSTLIDMHGYLWLATNKGVVRYNGYNTRLFNSSDGIPKEDIWKLYEDKKGRIWLITISDQLGYIYNNKYIKAYNTTHVTLYPSNIAEYDSGIVFTSPFVNGSPMSYCIEKHDSIYHYASYPAFHMTLVNKQNEFALMAEDTIYKVYINIAGHRPLLQPRCVLSFINDEFAHFKYNNLYMYNHYIISYTIPGTFLSIVNLNDCSYKKIFLDTFTKKDNTLFQIIDVNDEIDNATRCLLVIATKNIYFIDSDLRILLRYPVDSITKHNLIGNDINYMMSNAFWQQCIATSKNGLFINYRAPRQFYMINSFNTSGYTFIGTIADSTSYWWNNITKTIVMYDGHSWANKKYSNVTGADKIIQYNKDSSLLLCSHDIFWFNNYSHTVTDFFTGLYQTNYDQYFGDAFDVFIQNPQNIYALSKGAGFMNVTIKAGRISRHTISDDRYTGMMYDTTRDIFWIYSYDKLLIYKRNGSLMQIGTDVLKTFGVSTVEKILIDNKYGNIFIKDAQKLLMLNTKPNKLSVVLDNINLKDAKVFYYKDKLIVAGDFGIAFSTITGPMQISKPVIYPNIKNLLYTTIQDVAIFSDKVLIKTDTGLYQVSITTHMPHPGTNSEYTQYKFILNYDDTLFNIHQNDTFSVSQNKNSLQFDIINPYGNGQVKYKYTLAGSNAGWNELNTNELTLPKLKAGQYYHLSVVAYDNVWKSKKINIYLFIIPYWWQTTMWKTIFWIAGLLVFALVITIASLITKSIVTRNNARKNQQLEIELRSIYSQINPHFIFNTLNSGLSLIKMNELDKAYTHISRFSSLLRSYIKSSRNRFITISEEIINLKNYIELQQARFKERFDYQVIIEGDLQVASIKIPSLLLQPIVENAINHGLLNKKEKGLLKIVFRLANAENEIVCIIEDDGIGRERSRLLNQQSSIKRESYGEELLSDLVAILNNYEEMNIHIKYIDKQLPYTGTIVEIKMNTRL